MTAEDERHMRKDLGRDPQQLVSEGMIFINCEYNSEF
jgi:hypothetical protein